MIKGFKPMLLNNEEVLIEDIDFNKEWYCSIKLDGVRIELSREGVFGRSLKKIRNVKVQEAFKDYCSNIPEDVVIEAELWSPSLPCHLISGVVNRKDEELPIDLRAYCFDAYLCDSKSFEQRLEFIELFNKNNNCERVTTIRQLNVNNKEELQHYFNKLVIDHKNEGLVVKNVNSPYKKGRVTTREAIGYKLKPFKEQDVKIVGVNERMINTNESLVNELGHSYKRNTKDAKVGSGIAGTITVINSEGVEFKASLTGSEDERREILNNKDYYIGLTAVIKSMSHGEKDKPRHPTVVRIK